MDLPTVMFDNFLHQLVLHRVGGWRELEAMEEVWDTWYQK